MKLENWLYIKSPTDLAYVPPTQREGTLFGMTEDGYRSIMHPRRRNEIILDGVGQAFELGAPHADYERQYPNARECLIASMDLVTPEPNAPNP